MSIDILYTPSRFVTIANSTSVKKTSRKPNVSNRDYIGISPSKPSINSKNTYTNDMNSRVSITVWSTDDFSKLNHFKPTPFVYKRKDHSKYSKTFANASFSETPLATDLPAPPEHWMSSSSLGSTGSAISACSSSDDDNSITSTQSCAEMTTALKLILNVGESY